MLDKRDRIVKEEYQNAKEFRFVGIEDNIKDNRIESIFNNAVLCFFNSGSAELHNLLDLIHSSMAHCIKLKEIDRRMVILNELWEL